MPPRLLRAYRQTRYSAGGVVVLVGRRVPDALFAQVGAREAVFVTAWNPRSHPTAPAENAAAATALAAEIATRGLRALPHRGVGDDPVWPAEEGWFILDLDEAAARALAEAHGQNAIVWIEPGAAPRLVETAWLLRDD